MITKKEFKDLNVEEQVDLVNQELLNAKGTKNFGANNLDFSYGFARSILTNNGYDTLDEQIVDGIKIKTFRKMNENELLEKEAKLVEKEEQKTKEEKLIPQETNSFDKLHLMIANDIYLKNKENHQNEKTISKTLPIFESTYQELNDLLQSDEFKMYEKKYVIEMMIRSFLDKYKQ